jgi:hypothetical protein
MYLELLQPSYIPPVDEHLGTNADANTVSTKADQHGSVLSSVKKLELLWLCAKCVCIVVKPDVLMFKPGVKPIFGYLDRGIGE